MGCGTAAASEVSRARRSDPAELGGRVNDYSPDGGVIVRASTRSVGHARRIRARGMVDTGV